MGSTYWDVIVAGLKYWSHEKTVTTPSTTTNNTETDFKKFIKELDLGSPIAILTLQNNNRSNHNKATNAFLRLHDTSLHTKTATVLNNMKFLD